MLKKIIQPLDMSESLAEVKMRASFIDRFGGEEIVLVHVMNPGLGDRGLMQSRLTHLVDALGSVGIQARSMVMEGHVASEITRTAMEVAADVIYLPASRKNILVSSFLGSTTEDVMRLSDLPVFIHKLRPELVRTEKVRNLVFATDFRQAACRAWLYVRMLGRFVSKLTILHVGERAADPDTEQLRREHAERMLSELNAKFKDDFQDIALMSRIGSPARHILDIVEQIQADLVVLGRLNEPFPSKLLGSTCSRVTSRVSSSVLLIP
ncbi:universal stress protein [Desulfonatronum thioautotrophicum]|uniref:universal stress protein n=1 Tax=Desulfonatronum thioautotrophicum TaxID=617001 RepID=UPI0005EBCDFE|nr:universal stress protein [Desulfonatronum thioautotrophicum]